MKISCAFPPSQTTVSLIQSAEAIGFQRAWCYDSPALYSDVWMTLALAARSTTKIELGPGVLVPSLRHPIVTSAAALTLNALAPGRTALAIGAGFTGTRTLGQPPSKWKYVADYVHCVRELLHGNAVEWDGALIELQSLAQQDLGPVEIPILIGADGPIGRRVAEKLGDGIVSNRPKLPATLPPVPYSLIVHGTVLRDGEQGSEPRVREVAGPGAAIVYHALYERGADDSLRRLAGGDVWLSETTEIAEDERHLRVHGRHMVSETTEDTHALDEALRREPGFVSQMTFTGSKSGLADRLSGLAERGIAEIIFQPSSVDTQSELERFAQVAQL